MCEPFNLDEKRTANGEAVGLSGFLRMEDWLPTDASEAATLCDRAVLEPEPEPCNGGERA